MEYAFVAWMLGWPLVCIFNRLTLHWCGELKEVGMHVRLAANVFNIIIWAGIGQLLYSRI